MAEAHCPPIVISAGGTRQLIAWLPNALCSLDPGTGGVQRTGGLKLAQPARVRSA